jgi:hypothetical protein
VGTLQLNADVVDNSESDGVLLIETIKSEDDQDGDQWYLDT